MLRFAIQVRYPVVYTRGLTNLPNSTSFPGIYYFSFLLSTCSFVSFFLQVPFEGKTDRSKAILLWWFLLFYVLVFNFFVLLSYFS